MDIYQGRELQEAQNYVVFDLNILNTGKMHLKFYMCPYLSAVAFSVAYLNYKRNALDFLGSVKLKIRPNVIFHPQ